MFRKLNLIDDSWKKLFLTLGVILICLLFFSLIGTEDFVQKITKSFFFLFLIPFLYVKYVLKENFTNFGFNLNNKKNGFLLSLVTLVIAFLVIYILTIYTNFERKYLLTPGISQSFLFFLVYTLFLINIPLFFQEFFFKGFLLETFRNKWGYFSILFQVIIYLAPLFFLSSNYWNLVPLILISLLGGIVSYLTKSFFYSYFFSILFLILMNAFLVYLNK